MALSQFKTQFNNAYEQIFLKALVAKEVMNTRFQDTLSYGQSVARVAIDISGVRVRSVTRGAASTIDTVADSNELLTINLEKEAVFHISDGEVTQAGPMNPGEFVGGKIGQKVAIDLDARCFAEVRNATIKFDTGDLTTTASSGTPITLSSTTVPQMVARMGAKLRYKNNQVPSSDLIIVVDSYAAGDIEQYLMGKNIDVAASVFQNGYAGDVRNAQMYVSENLTGESLGTTTGVFSNGETIVINGVTLTAVAAIGATPGNFLIGASAAVSLTNLAGLINNPGVTSANQVALATADQITFTDALKLVATATATTVSLVGIGSGRMVLSTTGALFTWTRNWINVYFGKRGGIDLVVQNMKMADMRETPDRRGTNVFSSYLAGLKTFADGAKTFLDVQIAV
jgi:hypothetical protein